MICFTSSWDDGAVQDLRLAELLLKYNQKATFFIPLHNVEKRQVISTRQIAALAVDFEIGAHTMNHKYLTAISDKEAEYEIKESKKVLESIINKQVPGFCFPGGKYKPVHLQFIRDAGFTYARTVNMFNHDNDTNIMNTTLQAYNHSKYTYFKHLLKRGYVIEILRHSVAILTSNRWEELLMKITDGYFTNDTAGKITVIHLWGHSWEIAENNAWKQLECFLKRLAGYKILSATNHDVFQLTIKNKQAQTL